MIPGPEEDNDERGMDIPLPSIPCLYSKAWKLLLCRGNGNCSSLGRYDETISLSSG